MDFSNFLSSGFASLTGQIQKAVVKISDTREADEKELKKLKAVMAGGGSGQSGIGGAMAITDNSKALGEKASGTGGFKDQLGGNKLNRLKEDGVYNKMFEVQFNPSTMSISGFAGGDVARINYNQRDPRSSDMRGMEPNLQFSVRLQFDQMDKGKTFPGDNFNMSGSAALQTGKKLLTDNVTDKGKINDVQTIVEGFLATLRNPKTSRVAFQWGDMEYSGVLQQVNANYTLFDATARPVRAEVDLTIYLRDRNIKSIDTGFDLGYWYAAYKSAFQDSHSYVGVGQQIARQIPGINKLVN